MQCWGLLDGDDGDVRLFYQLFYGDVASMFFGFRNWFQGRQKDRADAYNKDLMEIFESAERGEHDEAHYHRALADVLKQVVEDLDNDRISSDGFDEFSFTCLYSF